jgi:hypothetical protein
VGANAHASATTADADRDRWISRVRPTTSDRGPATRRAIPRPIVVSDRESVLCAAETSKARASSGSSVWVL